MRSVRSFFNPTLYKKNLTRFWPIWGLYLIIWLFLFPIGLILGNEGGVFYFANRTVLTNVIGTGLPLAVIFSLLSAIAVWSYLCNNRSACLMHSLPVRRDGLFLTNFLSGMTFLAGPNLIVFVLTLLAEAALGEVDAGALAVWFISVTLMELFFFCFATFCAMCTGHVLGLPVLYVVFNVLAAGVTALVETTLDRFVFGYAGDGIFNSGLVKFLTPVWMLEDNLEVRYEYQNGERLVESAWLSGVGYILVYAVVGLGLAALAYALYRRRQMERAGDVITVGWMRPVFQYGVAFCVALAFGTLFFEMFRGTLPDTAWTLLFFMLLCGAVGYFIAKMLLEKSFRVFRCWKGCVPFLAALVLLTCVMEFDLVGYEGRVPETKKVESVFVTRINTLPYDEADGLGMEFTDPELIDVAADLHRTIVDNKWAIERDTYGGAWAEDMPGSYPIRIKEYTSVQFIYNLLDNTQMIREYTIPLFAEDLKDPASLTAKVDTLVNHPRVIDACYGLSDESAEDIVELFLSGVAVEGSEHDSYMVQIDTPIRKEAYELVLNAVLADLAEGNIGRRYLMDTQERMENCYANDLEFVFYRGKPAVVKEYAYDFTPYGTAVEVKPTTEPSDYTERITVTLQTTSKHTLAALRQTGVLKGPVPLLTQADYYALQAKVEDHAKYGLNGEKADAADYADMILGG